MTSDEWAALFAVASFKKSSAIPGPGLYGLVGRSITKAAGVVVRLWGKYQRHLIPVLNAATIAALDALAATLPDLLRVNPPGPQ